MEASRYQTNSSKVTAVGVTKAMLTVKMAVKMIKSRRMNRG